MLLPFLVSFLPEIPMDFFGDEGIEDDDQTEKPPEIPQPDHPRDVEQSPESELCPPVAGEILQAHFKLFYRLDDSFECLRIVHGEVGENLAVETDVLRVEFAHELRIGNTVLTCSGIDSLNPEGAESALLGFTVAVCVSQTLLIGVLGYRPDILS